MHGHSPAPLTVAETAGRGGSKMGDKPPFTSGPGAVPTYTGTRAWPSVKPAARRSRREVKQRGSGIGRGEREQ